MSRQPLLILASSKGLLPMLVPARDVRALPMRLAGLVATRLRRLPVSAAAVDAETSAMEPVVISPTVDRSVLGILVDFAKMAPYHLQNVPIDARALQLAEDRLVQTPCYAGLSFEQVVFPDKKVPELLRAKWGAG